MSILAMNCIHLDKDEESLYTRCLFRTIELNDIKRELVNRNCDPSKLSYYTMTLKLQLLLLKEANTGLERQKELTTELSLIIKETDKRYTCSVPGCSFSCMNYKHLLSHLSLLHSNCSSASIICQVNGCTRVLSSIKMLKLHIKTSHNAANKSSVSLRQNALTEELSSLRCLSVACSHQRCKSLKDLKAHVISVHTDRLENVACLFEGCNFSTNVTGTLRSHFSRKHPLHQMSNLKSQILTLSDCSEVYNPMVHETISRINLSQSFDEFDHPQTSDQNCSSSEISGVDLDLSGSAGDLFQEPDGEELFVKALAMQFNRWSNVKHVPYSTVAEIVTEVFNSYEQGGEVSRSNVSRILLEKGLMSDEIHDILKEVAQLDPFAVARKELENTRDRLKFISSEFDHIKPVNVRLNQEKKLEAPDTMQYIPIKQSLKSLLEDETFLAQKASIPSVDGMVLDCKDGFHFKRNEFFVKNPTAVPILLFQDELEVIAFDYC